MPFIISKSSLQFPDPSLADEDGLLAIGGDLSTERLLLAYSNGIFPWYSKDLPILWWSPDPRTILYPDKFIVSDSLKHLISKRKFDIAFDRDFESVIRLCASVPRDDQNGTWITNDMIQAYISLFKEGYAHSVETYYRGKIAGGLYGVALGNVFFGESMFHLKTDASKVALYHLIMRLKEWNFLFIDVQVESAHMAGLGAGNISRAKFLELLKNALKTPSLKGRWK
jgi:leucyl/phenylalanyl-tRNA--protein transferase